MWQNIEDFRNTNGCYLVTQFSSNPTNRFILSELSFLAKVTKKLLGGTSFFYILPMPAIQKASRQSPSPEKQILQGYTDVSASQYALPYQSGHCV